MIHRYWLRIFLAGVLFPGVASAERVELAVYYPSPGDPDMHLRSLTVGTPYANETTLGDGEVLIFDRMGIGTNDPRGPLHVVGVDDTVSSVIFMPGVDTGGPPRPGIRVGIGTASPTQMLEVAHPQDAAYVWVRGLGDVDNFSGLELRSIEAVPKSWQLAHKKGGVGGINDFQINSFNGTDWTPRVAIQPGGNVGIGGVTAPASRLQVQGGGTTAASSSLNVTNSAGGSLFFVRDDGYGGVGTATPQAPAPNALGGNLDANDLYLRSLNDWFSRLHAHGSSKMWRTNPQPIPNDTLTVIDFDWIEFNGGGMAQLRSGATPSRFVIPAGGGGIYKVEVQWVQSGLPHRSLPLDQSGVIDIWAVVLLNGATVTQFQCPGNYGWSSVSGSELFQLQAGNVITVALLQKTGSSISTQGSRPPSSSAYQCPRASIVRVR